jgi:acetyl-CoA C-acetyltransferase
MEHREAVICEPVRTPVGKNGGALRQVSAAALAATVVAEILRRTGLPPETVEDVIFGQAFAGGDAPAIGRVAALDARLPVAVPGMQVDRGDGSGLQAVIDAVMRIRTAAESVIVAEGVESMSNVERYAVLRSGRRYGGIALANRVEAAVQTAAGRRHPFPDGLIGTVEALRREYAISRGAGPAGPRVTPPGGRRGRGRQVRRRDRRGHHPRPGRRHRHSGPR